MLSFTGLPRNPLLSREERAYGASVNPPTPARAALPAFSRLVRSLPTAALLVAVATAAHAASVARFSPEGHVKQPQQATARFSAPMVPFGDLTDVAPPFDVECGAKGKSRWIDSVTWAYDFEQPLPAGMRCTFTLRDGAKALDGSAVTGTRAFTFTTGGPAVTQTRPWAGDSGIDERQVFLLGLDGDVDAASVRKHAGFSVEGLPERIEAEIVGGAELEGLLAGMSKWARPSPPLVALRARRAFPNGSKVRLVWGKGVRSPSGEATTSAQTFEFRTRAAFSVSTACRRENARSGCVPILPVSVEFSAPVAREVARRLRLVGPDGAEKAPAEDDDEGEAEEFTQSVEFTPPFAENATYAVKMPDGLADDAGRTLPAGQKALSVKTAALPVLAKFATNFGIVERHASPALPITLRNIEPAVAGAAVRPVAPGEPGTLAKLYAQLRGTDLRLGSDDPKKILEWLRRVSSASRRRSIFEAPPGAGSSGARKDANAGTATGTNAQASSAGNDAAATAGARDGAGAEAEPTRRTFTIPKPLAPRETEVVGLALEEPGLHVVEIESPLLGAALLGQQRPMYVAAAALVTNLAVHFKQGREGSVAWVTTLDRAEPVAGARVVVADCNGAELAAAETDDAGVARFDALPSERALPNCWQNREQREGDDWRDFSHVPALSSLESGLFVVASTEDDMTFVHSSWSRGIEPWRFGLPGVPWQSGELTFHTVFDRPLYRTGETAHMKFVVRRRSMDGFTIPPAAELPKSAVVEFTATGQTFDVPVEFDDLGIATADWPVPADAKLGSYAVVFPSGDSRVTAGDFRVEQFRVPLVRGEISAPAVVEPHATSLPVDVSVRYLAGGPAARLPVVLRSELRPGASFDAPEDYDDYTFASGAVREGLDEEEDDDAEEDDSEPQDDDAPKLHSRRDVELDAAGGARVVVDALPAVERPTRLVVEAEFRDPNGEVETVATSRLLLPSALVPGIRVEDWTDAGDKLQPEVVVLTPDGKPAAGVPVRVEAARREWYSHRKRLVGGFYGYDSRSETRALGLVCEGTTGADGKFTCDAKPPAKGQLVLEATVTDAGGRAASTYTEAWVPGEDSGFDTTPDDRIDVVPEKRAYEPGETARLQVRMPFREATALVTVEREGVGEARVVRLSAENPVVEVPVRGEHAPNVFVSVLLVRGRVGDVQPTAMLDLGRPAYRLGVAELQVDWKAHRLGVAVATDRETYRVRETASVSVAVTRHDSSPAPAGSEVAVAAVDEGLLELLPNGSWKLLDAMMGRRPYEVETSTAQGQVVGKRHYGRKAVAVGGGGGAASARELFDTLLLWAPRVKLDASGRASVEVPLNDSLTAFRIVAVATAGDGEFGDGAATIRTTRELATFSGLPPLVREGDAFAAEFTLRNTGDRPLDVVAKGSVAGGAAAALPVASGSQAADTAALGSAASGPLRDLEPQRVTLAPGEGRTVTWPVAVPAGQRELAWTVRASAGDVEDVLAVKQKVVPAHRVEVVQATLAQLDGTSSMPVAAPRGAVTDAGGSGIAVSAAASLATTLDATKDWLARYPYTCLEQRVSVAIGREDDAAWTKLAGELASFQDADGLLTYFPGERLGDDRLTAYVLSVAKAAGRALPEDVESNMVAGLQGFVAGRVLRSSGLDVPDRTLRRLSAIEAIARAGKAEASMLGSIELAPALWPTSAVLDWSSILARTKDIPDAAARQREVEQVLRARLDLSGTTLAFAGERDDDLWWMMASGDSNAVRLLLHLSEHGLWKEDAPRVLRGVVARREGGAWQTTVANAWGVVAMRRFAAAYEGEQVGGRTGVALAGAEASIDWSAPQRTVTLPWPDALADLTLRHDGAGKPWITTVARAAVPRTEPVAAGYRISRSVTPLDPHADGLLRRGDRLRVRLEIDAQREMWWVVVDDPVPAGASHLGSGLGRGAAGIVGGAAGADDLLHPAFVERSQQSWRAYLRHLPRGRSRLEYTIRVNQAGTFGMPATRVEALYAPELFGEAPNAVVQVEP